MNYKEKYNEWLNSKVISESVKEELRGITDEKELEDRFYKELDFGTGGLRGVIGYGSNRMNVYTVSKATQGFANYLNKNFESPKVAIAYDSRNMSKEFAEAAALTLCANNVKVECSAEAIPKYIDFNVGTGTVGSVYKFGDLEVASEISILDDLNSVIASISYERKTVSDDMDEAQEADIKDVAE